MKGGGAKGVVGIVSREFLEVWLIELTHFHRPNVVISNLVTSYLWTPVIRSYLPPSTLNHLLDL